MLVGALITHIPRIVDTILCQHSLSTHRRVRNRNLAHELAALRRLHVRGYVGASKKVVELLLPCLGRLGVGVVAQLCQRAAAVEVECLWPEGPVETGRDVGLPRAVV